jgi:hypothetical protein
MVCVFTVYTITLLHSRHVKQFSLFDDTKHQMGCVNYFVSILFLVLNQVHDRI